MVKLTTIKKTEDKPIAVISRFTGMVKLYNYDGSRNSEHPVGFYHQKDLDFYKQNYIVKFAN